jgi:hypothetical protein
MEIVLAGARRVWFQGCPAKHASDVLHWLHAFHLLELWRMTPAMAYGLDANDLDPRYWQVMQAIKAEITQSMRQKEPERWPRNR